MADGGDLAVDHEGGEVGDGEGRAGELLDHEHRHAVSRQLSENVVEVLDDERGEAHGQLVDE